MTTLVCRLLTVGLLLLVMTLSGGATSESVAQKEPFSSLTEALQALSHCSGKVVCWVGTPPVGPVSLPEGALTLADVVREWASRWEAAVMTTPHAIFFHTPGTFAHVRPAHEDELLPIYRTLEPLHRLPLPVLNRFPFAPDMALAKEAESTLRSAIALTEVEQAAPGFEAELRKLLEAAGARVLRPAKSGEDRQLGAYLETLPAEQIYLRLAVMEHIYCMMEPSESGAEAPQVEVEIPLSKSRLAVDADLSQSVAVLQQALEKSSFGHVRVHTGSLDELIRGGALTTDNRTGPTVVVDRRLIALPLTVFDPVKERSGPVWPVLEGGIGVERRDLGDVLFFGPWLDAESHAELCFLSRWIGARQQLWTTVLTPYNFKGRIVKASLLAPEPHRLIRAELVAQAERDESAAKFPLPEFLDTGSVAIYQSRQLDILQAVPGESTNPPVVLGTYSFSWR